MSKPMGSRSSSGASLVPGPDAYACLTSVPFNQTLAKGFVTKYNSTLQFHSNTAWLKDPPTSYKQPATDLQGRLNDIAAAVDQNKYANEYEFEAALIEFAQSAHDGHFFIAGGATAQFNFRIPFPLSSISSDGTSLPKPYVYWDLIYAANSSGSDWKPSPLQTINGQDAVQWLQQYAANYSSGWLEPNVDYNNLFQSSSNLAGGLGNVLNFNSRYPGDWFNVTFENTTQLSNQTLAAYKGNTPVPSITSGEDFFAAFVVEQTTPTGGSVPTAVPTATETGTETGLGARQAAETTPAQPQATGWLGVNPDLIAYPGTAAVVQPNLGKGGFLTGYFYPDQSLAVMSLPSFEVTGVNAQTFSASINEFITKAQAAGLKQVLIDVSSNGGGDALMSTELFKNFFPTIEPYSGSRMRVHDAFNVLGNAYTNYYLDPNTPEQAKAQILGSVWTAPTYLNAATNQTFANWGELSQNYTQEKDLFTITLRNNLTNTAYDLQSTSGDNGTPGIVIDGYANRSNSDPKPFDASNVAILTDGICASTCTTFMEMFHHEGGVKIVVAGGRPEYGPMQGNGGVRGAQAYKMGDLNDDITQALQASPQLASQLPSTQTYLNFGKNVGFNLRDQVRSNESFPLEFAYMPADCRIFYTAETVNNYTALWQYAARAALGGDDGQSLCVKDSTGQSESYGNGTNVGGPNGTSSGSPTSTTGSGGSSPTSPGSSATSSGAASANGVTFSALFIAAGVAALL